MLAVILCFAFTACKKETIEFKTEVKYSVYEQVEGDNVFDMVSFYMTSDKKNEGLWEYETDSFNCLSVYHETESTEQNVSYRTLILKAESEGTETVSFTLNGEAVEYVVTITKDDKGVLRIKVVDNNDEESGEPIEVENGLYVKMPESGTLKIAQFADLHFGTEGKPYQNDKEERTKAYMKYIAENHKPDLIVCSGDNIMSTGVSALEEFAELMDSLKTPWTFVYGNHDAESNASGFSKKELSKFLSESESPYLLYSEGYVEEASNRYGNFSISVLNNSGTKLLGAILLFDAGVYSYSKSDYESITKGQIEWYESELDKLNKSYDGEMLPTIVFSHIQLPEFHEAYLKAEKGDGAEFVIKQALSTADISEIKGGGPTLENTGLYDVMVEKGSTKAFFVGHAHTFDFQMKMDGILLGFGPQTGFSTLFPNNDLPRRSYIYNVDKDFGITTEVATEPGDDLGLTFCGTYDGAAEYDEASGSYKATLTFNAGNDIVFGFNGARLKLADITLSGAIAENAANAGSDKLYPASDIELVFNGKPRSFTFVYDPETKTLDITSTEIEANPDAPTSIVAKTLNSDAGADAVALWTKAGTKICEVTNAQTGESAWIGNGWRYYVVVDAEGRIAYAVQWPNSGYGGPAGSGYYCNEYYSDYTNNPAIKLLDGYANDWAEGGIGYNLFEIVIPEGGFAITSHGETNNSLIDMLSQGTVENYDISNINTRSIYDSDVRLSYDESTKTISLTVD